MEDGVFHCPELCSAAVGFAVGGEEVVEGEKRDCKGRLLIYCTSCSAVPHTSTAKTW